MKKFVLLLAALGLALTGLPATADMHGCDVAAPAEPVQVNFIGWTFPILDFYASEIESCNQVENLDVNAQVLQSADAQNEMRLAASSTGASPYDIVHGSNAFIGELAALGWLMPLNDLIDEYSEAYDLGDMSDAMYAAATLNGNIYGIPIIVNTSIFMYNGDLLEAAGVEPPQTYDDVIGICNSMALEGAGADMGFGLVVSAGWAWRVEYVNLYGTWGGHLLDENLMPAFNSETGIAALDKLLEIVDACLGEEGVLLSTDDVQAGLANGSIAMAHIWASRAAMMDDEELSDVVGVIEFAPALHATADTPNRGGIPWADFLAIPATSEIDKDLLFQIIMEAADLDSQLGAAEFGLVPRNGASANAPRYSEASLTTIAEGGPAIDHPAQQIANSALGQFLPMAATGEMTSAEALQAAADLYVEEATAQGYIG
ncbi:MAG: extracellular solute-binding protein [Anaerolineaceae bacterium]|nr:extracellular solute-binding protein [Anaerolineaceae bacterium]